MTKKILIIGNSAKEHALAGKFKKEGYEIHVAPGNVGISEIATCVDIRPDSLTELVEYVMENGIDLTIPTNPLSLKKGIANLFKNNNLHIFASEKAVFDLLYDKASMKKILYRLKIPTPKFGIFEKPAMALDYIKNIELPFVIKTNEPSSAVVVTSVKTAKNIISLAFEEMFQKVIIEDYIQGSSFCFYVITDGYKALPIGSSKSYRYTLDGDGGQLTNGMGACSPNYCLTEDNEQYILDKVVAPLLDYFQASGTPYMGIIGVEAVLTPDKQISVLGINTFMQDGDCQAVLNNIDESLYDIIESCVIGSFSDDIDSIKLKNIYSSSVTLSCANRENNFNSISGLELLSDDTDVNFYPNVSKNKYMELEAQNGQNLVLTCSAGTNSHATANVYEEINSVNFSGKFYRKDIGNSCKY